MCYADIEPKSGRGVSKTAASVRSLLFLGVSVPKAERKGVVHIPNRIIKESVCTSGSVDKLGWFEEVVFYRLIVNVDDYGRLDARPAILRARLFPLKEVDTERITAALDKLQAVGCVERYEVDGAPYLWLPNWDKHQTIRAKRSKYPAPLTSASKCKQMHADASRCTQMQADAPVIQSESVSVSVSESPSEPAAGVGAMERAFEAFWAEYPNRSKRHDSRNVWMRLKPDEALQARIIAGVRAAKSSQQWQKEGGRYIPSAERYLRERRWEDELPPPRGMIASNLDTAAMDALAMRFVPRMEEA